MEPPNALCINLPNYLGDREHGLTKLEWTVIFIGRVILNLSFRVVYPYLPAISRGLNISFQQAGLFLTARSATGLAAILFGGLAQRIGYVRWMAIALSILLLGGLLISLSGSFFLALLGFALLGLAQTAYVPASQAYVSATVPYSKRGRVIGLIETSWPASWFLGIPICGVLIASLGWRSPFLLITAAGLVTLFVTARMRPPSVIPQTLSNPSADRSDSNGLPFLGTASTLVLFTTFFISFANENIMVIFGAWLERSFSLQVEALGFLSSFAGLAELGGDLTVALAVDRLGKRRTLAAGMLTASIAYLGLIACRHSLILAIAGLMAVFFLSELIFVSMVSYVSELSPLQRGKWLAANFSMNVAGRLCASLSGPWLWAMNQTILPNAVISSLSSLLGCALFSWISFRSARS